MQVENECKITEIFCVIDDFCKEFAKIESRNAVSDGKSHRNKPNRMSDAEVILIMINLSSMYGNWLFLLLVYCLPLFFPNLHVLTLAAMMFSFAELLMHLILFNVRLKACYNPGMITGVFMLPPIAIYYFARVFDASLFSWYHYVIAVAWFVFVFWLSFRSPIYWSLGKKPGYDFTEQSAFGMYH